MFRVVKVVLVAAAALSMVFLAGCESKAQTGAVVGGAGGAGAGALIGGSHHAGEGALIGAAVGAAGGYIVGNEGDKKDMKQDIQSVRNDANTTVVNITNSNGSITPVIMRRSGNMWVGPKGEQYLAMPTVEQLKPVYGF
jgi:outer membrane murein-binding lipoprotein Lpp